MPAPIGRRQELIPQICTTLYTIGTIETFSKMMANYESQPELTEQFNYARDTVSKEIVIYNYFKCDEFKPFNHF